MVAILCTMHKLQKCPRNGGFRWVDEKPVLNEIGTNQQQSPYTGTKIPALSPTLFPARSQRPRGRVMLNKIDDAQLSAPASKAGRLQRACLALLKQHERDGAVPTNGRFLFYELEQQGVIPKAYIDASGRKKARQPAQDISDAMTVLRELGLVPWDWILDETRDVADWRFAVSVYKYVADSVEYARIDCWGGQGAPLIICESRATKGVLERIAG
jgi:hypothetical protein